MVDNEELGAKEWRNEVAYRTLALLRCSVAVILYPTTHIPSWDIHELNGFEREDVKNNLFLNPATLRYAHENRSEYEENLRVPIRLAYLLRKSIHSQEKRLNKPLHINRELKLLGSVDGFMTGFYGYVLYHICISNDMMTSGSQEQRSSYPHTSFMSKNPKVHDHSCPLSSDTNGKA